MIEYEKCDSCNSHPCVCNEKDHLYAMTNLLIENLELVAKHLDDNQFKKAEDLIKLQQIKINNIIVSWDFYSEVNNEQLRRI